MDYTGLSSKEALEKLKTLGLNEIPEVKEKFITKLAKRFVSPISLMLLAASILSLGGHKVFDFYFILFLLLLNVFIALWQESKADNAIAKLNQHLATKVMTLRDGTWQKIDSREIVPGDIIKLTTGNIIPGDGKVLDARSVTVNEAALTGESLPKDKNKRDKIFSGAFLITGLMVFEVTATGRSTYFGKTLISVERVRKRSLLEEDIISISKFLSILSLAAVVVLSVVFLYEKAPIFELLSLDLSLVIAGIPVSLPTVMTLIIEFGVLALAAKNAIVRRLSALEDLANVDLLLTDKTGTLTQNRITVNEIINYKGYQPNDVLFYALQVCLPDQNNSINKAIFEKAQEAKISEAGIKNSDFIPADSVRKRATITVEKDGKKILLSLGAPQVVASLCKIDSGLKSRFEKEVESLAQKGYRTLAVSYKENSSEEKDMSLVGVLALSDILRDDAKDVVSFLETNNIGVALLTGDNRAISREIARRLDLSNGKVVTGDELHKIGWKNMTPEMYHQTGAFSEILPDDKFELVKAAKRFFVVAANGDGVNDLPAIKEANVGIAVKNAVDALKSTADIVLLTSGISVIRDALIESRKIFARLYTYSLYRISESLRLIITIAILGLIYRQYPMTPLQIILIALLNDIPIISLAWDRVRIAQRPEKIKVKERFLLSSLYGLAGIGNSLILFFILTKIPQVTWSMIQTIYFLKLTVSGHMLIFVAHTKARWFRFLPSRQVIIATLTTQVIASILALTGFFMPGPIPIIWVVIVWVWAFCWMQITELMKEIQPRIYKETG
ncbi:MAG: plasma-membrane proton-efflux P-type ATPase [Patescibacteria group bacterium]|nr:plasma-membrane proton-efflux P-type ATPase [Patescibacteria group bacterium]